MVIKYIKFVSISYNNFCFASVSLLTGYCKKTIEINNLRVSLQTVNLYIKFVSAKSYTNQSRCIFCKPHRNRLNPVKLSIVRRVMEAFAASAFIAATAVELSGGI